MLQKAGLLDCERNSKKVLDMEKEDRGGER